MKQETVGVGCGETGIRGRDTVGISGRPAKSFWFLAPIGVNQQIHVLVSGNGVGG